MAGGDHLNPVDYPPLPSVHLNQNKHQQFPSSKTLDRDNLLSATKVLNSENLTPENQASIDLVVGSITIPPIHTPLEPQISISKTINRVSSKNPTPPTILLESQQNIEPLPCSISKAVEDPLQPNKDCKKDDKVQVVARSNLAKAFMGNLDLHPCHHILGKACVSFSMEEKQSLISSMNFIVVVKFSHFRPKFHAFNSFLMNMGFLGKYRIMEFDLKHIFVEFLVFEDFCKLWMMKSCFIGGFRGRFFKWDGNFSPGVESYMAPVWVHLPHFPLYLFNEKSILSVASVFGKPLCIDSAASSRFRVGKLSVCIARDVREKGPNEIMVEFVGDGIMVDRFTQLVNYGEIPDYCNCCCHLGHSIDACKVVDGLHKPLGPVSSRLQDGAVEGIGTVIPIVSVFDRLQDNMKGRDKEAELMIMDRDTVLVEDVHEGDDVICDSEHSTAENRKANAQMHYPDSSTTLTLKPSFSVSGAVDHGNVVGTSCMLPEVKDRTEEAGVPTKEVIVFLGENRNSATIAVQEPSLEPHNSLCDNNGVQAFGVLERGVGNLQLSSKFEAIAAVKEEIIAVENEVLQENSSNCVECATFNEDFSQLEQDMQVIPGATDSLLGNLKVTEEILAKSQKGCSETEFENWKNLQSAAESVREATLQEDISQIKQDMQVIPSALDSIHGTLQVAEESLAISQKGCSENEFENGKLIQSAAESVEEATLGGHISTSRDFQTVVLGVPERPIVDLQRHAELDLIAQYREEISDSENGGSSENAAESSTLNEHNFFPHRDTGLILDVPESQEDNIFETPILDINATTGSVFVWLAKKVFERVRDRLYPPDFRGISLEFAKQVLEKVCIIQGAYLSHADPLDKGVKQVQNMLVNKLSPRKVVITHPITREVINLASPSRSQSSMSSQASTIPVSSKTQQNQIKKARKKAKKQRLAEKKIAKLADMSTPQLKELAKKIIPERSYEKVVCKVNLQDWSGLDCNRSKDSAFWRNYHGAVREMGDEDYPFMFRSDDSEEVDIESATPKRYYEPP